MLALVPALLLAQYYPPPPSPAPAPVGSVPCSFQASSTVNYDLRPLRGYQLPAIAGSGGSQMYVSICSAPHRSGGKSGCTQSECPASTCTCHDPAGVDLWTGSQQDCAATGSLATGVWQLKTPGDLTGGVMVHYDHGDGNSPSGEKRSMTLVFACDAGVDHAETLHAVEEPPLRYTVTVASRHACAITPQPLSWGWLTIIFSAVALVLYLGIGIGYNIRYRGEEGLDVIPQWHYWQQLPGLVKDGAVFSWTHGRSFAHHARGDIRAWWAGRNSQEMRAPVMAAAE